MPPPRVLAAVLDEALPPVFAPMRPLVEAAHSADQQRLAVNDAWLRYPEIMRQLVHLKAMHAELLIRTAEALAASRLAIEESRALLRRMDNRHE